MQHLNKKFILNRDFGHYLQAYMVITWKIMSYNVVKKMT